MFAGPYTSSIRGALAAAVFLISLGTACSVFADFREFTSHDGKTIRAEIVSASETEVKLRMEDGREINGGISFFSDSDQAFINKWREANFDYRFEVDFTKKRNKRDKVQEGGSTEVVYEEWYFDVSVENATQTDLSNVEAQYKVYLSFAANADKRAKQPLKSEGKYRVLSGKAAIPKIERLRSVNFSTTPFQIAHSELLPGWYYANGSKDEKHDDIEGLWVRIMHNGKMVHEYKSSGQALQSAKW